MTLPEHVSVERERIDRVVLRDRDDLPEDDEWLAVDGTVEFRGPRRAKR